MTVSRNFGFVERRREARQAASSRARIHTGDSSRGCQLVDESANGARIIMGTDHPLPLRFHLEFARSRRRVPVQVVWQRGPVAGIRFDSHPFWLKILDPGSWFPQRRQSADQPVEVTSRRKAGV